MNNFFSLFVRFSVKEQMLFAKRLSFLVKAGVPILECLYLIRSQTKSKGKMQVYNALIKDVANGQYLASSLSKYPTLFGEFAINLIRVGESSGMLSQNLAYLADELHKKHALQRKVLGTLLYPFFITIFTIGLTGLLTAFIFPKLMPIFLSLHVELPLSTRMLVAVSSFLRAWGIVLVIAVVLAVCLFLIVRKRVRWLRYYSDYALLYIPLAGTIARAYNLTNFCRTLGLLLRSGVHLSEAMHITADTTTNLVYKRAYEHMTLSVIRGETISKGLLAEGKLFPDLLSHMIYIGEKTGGLVSTLTYLAEMHESEVDELTRSLSSSIEPMLMILMGIIVGFIAISVITPIYAITQHLTTH